MIIEIDTSLFNKIKEHIGKIRGIFSDKELGLFIRHALLEKIDRESVIIEFFGDLREEKEG